MANNVETPGIRRALKLHLEKGLTIEAAAARCAVSRRGVQYAKQRWRKAHPINIDHLVTVTAGTVNEGRPVTITPVQAGQMRPAMGITAGDPPVVIGEVLKVMP